MERDRLDQGQAPQALRPLGGEAQRDSAAVGMADEMDRLGALGKNSVSQRDLVGQPGRAGAAPRIGLAIAMEIRRQDAPVRLQALAQGPPLSTGTCRAMQEEHGLARTGRGIRNSRTIDLNSS